MPDSAQTYDGAVNNRSPLAAYTDNSFQVPRGSSFYYKSIVNGTTSATVKVECYEPLYIPSLHWGKGNVPAYASLQDLQLQLTFANALSRIWSHSATGGSTLTSVTCGISTTSSPAADANPVLCIEELTADPTVTLVEPHKPYVYPYNPWQIYTFDQFAGVTAGSSVSSSCQNIQLGVVPSRMYLFIRQRWSDQTSGSANWTSTDTFAAIQNLALTINGQSNILSECNPQQLYQMSVECGNKQSFGDFSDYQGSVLALDFGKHIPLDPTQNVGTVTAFNVQVSNLTIKNTSAATKNYTVVLVFQLDGALALTDNLCQVSVGMMSQAEAVLAPATRQGFEQLNQAWGGGWLDTVKAAIRNVIDPVAKPIVSVARTIGDVGSMLGYGIVGGKKKKMKKASKKKVRLGRGIVSHRVGGAINRDNEVGTMDVSDLYDEESESQSDE
jgi:hypothetical protein